MIDRRVAIMGALGLALGFSLSFIGFADWGEVHRMFTFTSMRLFFTFCGAVALTMIGFFVLARGKRFGARPLHRGTAIGAILFGVGWAICGACPAVSLVQIGEGKLSAIVTLLGMVAGTRLHAFARARWFRWDQGSCEA